jgi:hypothetical protein
MLDAGEVASSLPDSTASASPDSSELDASLLEELSSLVANDAFYWAGLLRFFSFFLFSFFF